MSSFVDFDLHGLVGVRLVDARPADAAAVRRQLGPIESRLEREPDIVIRFVDAIEDPSPAFLLGVNDAAFTEDSFLVLRGKLKTPARARIPFQEIGRRCEIVCESGIAAVPLLIAILNLTVLGKGALALHASAFIHQGIGTLCTGWSKGGKTETLLAFMAHGASYVGDEWVYLTADGRFMGGIPEPIRLWSWHLKSQRQLRERVGSLGRLKLSGFTAAAVAFESWIRVRRSARLAHRLKAFCKSRLFVDVPPERLFDRERCLLRGSPDRVLFVISQEVDEVIVETADPRTIAERMVHSLQEEQSVLRSYYHRFRFAFPDAKNDLIERSAELQQRVLFRILENKKAFVVRHPYPVSLPDLYDRIAPFLK